MISAILATHGNLADELIETAKEIYYDVSDCYPVSNLHKSPQSLRDELESIVAAGGPDDQYIVFVDFYGGSCCHACMALEMEHDNVRLITGVNLPMFLAFLYKRKEVDFDSLPGELVARGLDGIRLVSAKDE